MVDVAIINTSVLIALEKIELLDALCKVYKEIIVPEGVLKEFGKINVKCFKIQKVESSIIDLLNNELNLGKGESEVIALAISIDKLAILDDKRARKIAKKFGVKIVGTIGILLKMEGIGIIKSSYEKALDLKHKGFYVANEILEQLKRMGEQERKNLKG